MLPTILRKGVPCHLRPLSWHSVHLSTGKIFICCYCSLVTDALSSYHDCLPLLRPLSDVRYGHQALGDTQFDNLLSKACFGIWQIEQEGIVLSSYIWRQSTRRYWSESSSQQPLQSKRKNHICAVSIFSAVAEVAHDSWLLAFKACT